MLIYIVIMLLGLSMFKFHFSGTLFIDIKCWNSRK